MKYIIAAIMLCLTACSEHPKARFSIPQNKISPKPIDTSIYAVLKFDKAINYAFDKNSRQSAISAEEVRKVEILIDNYVDSYNKNASEFDPKIDNPKKYYKQLIVAIDSKGEKQVWVNCFCNTGEKSYWKKSIVLVMDGGSCYFNLKINLTKGAVYDFRVNGVA